MAIKMTFVKDTEKRRQEETKQPQPASAPKTGNTSGRGASNQAGKQQQQQQEAASKRCPRRARVQ
jgi:hypothetical protein